MTQDELVRRRPVWDAMSDFFLDTETRWNVPFVARRCAESGYDDEALERIFWAEVFPEAIENLLQVAGDWAMLALNEQALINRANHGSVPWLTRRAHGRMVQHKWLAARKLTAWLREFDAPTRELHVRALHLLGHRYFYEPERDSGVATAERFAEVIGIAREEWARYEPVCRAMLGEEEPAAGRAEAVRGMLGLQ